MDILLDRHFQLLKGRNIGLLSHQAALVARRSTSAQAVYKAAGTKLKALFGPEHGFAGHAPAGEKTYTAFHPEWNIPVYSLYGEMRSPSEEMLKGLDVVVCDLQDLGVRCYTYLATLCNMFHACRKAGVKMIVTDRPVPLPSVVDGPMLQHGLQSFVAPCNLPMVYGMTPAETVRWLSSEAGSASHVITIPMKKWQRRDSFLKGQGEFMPPSPGIATRESALSYAALVFCEALPGIDCGRGTNLVFRVFGAPWLESSAFCRLLNRRRVPGVVFHAYRYFAGTGRYKGRELNGIRISVTDPCVFRPVECSLMIIRNLERVYGESRVWRCKGVRQKWFDKLYGDHSVRQNLRSGEDLGRIFRSWKRQHAAFREQREDALLYT